jgi:hypothetical protein
MYVVEIGSTIHSTYYRVVVFVAKVVIMIVVTYFLL